MEINWWFVGAIVIGIAGALLWEESREYIIETFQYIIGLEWFGDGLELFKGLFEDNDHRRSFLKGYSS